MYTLCHTNIQFVYIYDIYVDDNKAICTIHLCIYYVYFIHTPHNIQFTAFVQPILTKLMCVPYDGTLE